jgi:thioesterase domain-containing protein
LIDLIPSELLARLRRLDIRVTTDGAHLRCSAPEGVLTSELRELIADHKPELIAFIQSSEARTKGSHSALIPLQTAGSRPRFYGVPGHNGDVFCFVHLSRHLGPDQPFYALQPPGLEGTAQPLSSLPELASLYADELCSFQPRDPFLLGGYCLGGTLAFETARQLVVRGREVSLLVLFGSPCPTSLMPPAHRVAARHAATLVRHIGVLSRRSPVKWMPYVTERLRKRRMAHRSGAEGETSRRRFAVENATVGAVKAYRQPAPFPGRVALMLPSEEWSRSDDRPLDWRRFTQRDLEVFAGPPGNDGDVMLREPHVKWAAERLVELIDSAKMAERASLAR